MNEPIRMHISHFREIHVKPIGILLILLFLQACAPKKTETAQIDSVFSTDLRIHDIYVAIKINGEKLERRVEMPRLELNLNTMQVFGTNGCNEFNAKIIAVTKKNISFSDLARTRKKCLDMAIPKKFDQALQKVTSYKYEYLHLTMYDKDGKELVTFLKVD